MNAHAVVTAQRSFWSRVTETMDFIELLYFLPQKSNDVAAAFFCYRGCGSLKHNDVPVKSWFAQYRLHAESVQTLTTILTSRTRRKHPND